jgi:hypothetical protein
MATRHRGAVGQVTRDVELAHLGDLLTKPPRAAVAFVENEAATILPAHACVMDGEHRFAVDAASAPDLSGREVVLMRDDGPYWFELRGISVRGTATRVPTPSAAPAERLVWYGVAPTRILAWDYAALREE